MNTPTVEELKQLAQQIPEKIPYLKMLVLFGSRATGEIHANSDWDFAILCNPEERESNIREKPWGYFEVSIILGEILGINSDEIDIVELNKSSQLISHYVARDGKVIYQSNSDEFDSFRKKALLDKEQMSEIYQGLSQEIEQFLTKWAL
ncbi:MAG: nucleotidyltransferase domain-containing protein [Rivularia sp. (in: cyanobacteria)]